MGKKRKSDASRLDEVDRTMYGAFRGAANSLSQLYTHAMNHQRVSFLAGERRGLGIKIMTGRGKRGGKRQNKKKNNSTREKVQEHNPAPIAEEFSGGNETQTDHHSATSQECQPLPPDELYFKNTEFTKSCKIQSKCSVSSTVEFLKELKPELEWFENHPQFCHIFHMPDEPNLRLLGMWTLLLRTIPLYEGEDTAWFAVNGVPIRYSMREHALISGLDCRDYPDKYEKLGSFAFVDRHFDSHKEITMESVKKKLLSMSACGDRLRMAVLYFLGTVIRAKARYNAPFDSFILRVVNNVEICKTFPWGRLTFDDAIRSINHVMKQLKGKPKSTVNFPGFIVPLEILAFECIPALSAQFRERVDGCLSNCPRMCKRRFQNNSMKGYPLEDLYGAIGETKVITSVLIPTVDEESLLARIVEGEPDYENEEGVSNAWSTWLTVKEKPIFWQELYELDVAAREFTKKKDKKKVNEEVSSSSHGLEDLLKGFEERLMTSLSEVNLKVETMDKRLGVMEKSQVVLKRRAKRMKAMEKRLDGVEYCQRYLKKKASKQKTMEEKLDGIEKEMKRNENREDFMYQNMGYERSYDRNEEEQMQSDKGEDGKESEEAAMEEDKGYEQEKEPEKDEKESEEAAMEEDKGSEQEKEPEKDEKKSEETTMEEQTESQLNHDNEIEEEVETENSPEKLEKEAAKEPKETPTPPRGRTKAAARRSSENWIPRKRFVLSWDEEADKYTEEEKQQHWILSLCKSNDGAPAVDEGAPAVDEPAEIVSAVDETTEGALVVDEEAPAVDEPVERVSESEEAAAVNETDERVPVVDEGAPAVDEMNEGAPARIGVKHRPKAIAVRNRPRKSTDPKKFTTPEQTTRTRARSRWVSSPFTEADTDEIEGRKKKPRTEA